MSQVELIDRAVVAIGRDQLDDDVLAPTRRAEELVGNARDPCGRVRHRRRALERVRGRAKKPASAKSKS